VLAITSKNLFQNEVYTYLVPLNSARDNLHLSAGKSMLDFIICFCLDPMLTEFLIIYRQTEPLSASLN
jgi:hypothetical protein